jgi:dTDP-4-dehydrorhamnose reductase
VAGRNFVEAMLALASDHGEVLVVRDQVGTPTYTPHLADALLRLIDGDAYGIHHLAAGGECSWYEFAQEIFRQAGVECRVMSCTTEEIGRPAPRPPYSVLGTERDPAILLPDWTEGLASYLAERPVRA